MATPNIVLTQNKSVFEVDYGTDKVQLSIVNGEISEVTSFPGVGGGLTVQVDSNIKLMVQAIQDYQAFVAAQGGN